MKQQRLLNWSIGVFVAFSVFGRAWERQVAEVHWIFVFVSLVLGSWAVFIAMRRLRDTTKNDVPAHRRLERGDYFRIFFTLWAGHWPLAATHLLGFWLFTCVAAILLCGLITVLCVDLFLTKQLTLLVIGCGFLIYFLLSWEHQIFVQHYGVPIIGHFFERPEYDARYYVDAERDGAGPKYRLLADIHVDGRLETAEDGLDSLGNPTSRTYSYRYVQVRRLHFPNGDSVAIDDQMDDLQLGASVFVTDTQGERWYVTLLNEYVH
jgi:hypothetical protein